MSLATPRATAQTEAPATAADNTLPVVKIRVAASAGERPPAQVEVTRSGAAVLDTPQTINVISAETAQLQGAQTIGDVVRNSASARPSNYFGTYESVYTRGFWMTTTSNYLRNGYRWVHLSQPAKRNVESYELIKGPAGLDYGRVEPGALMNIVTKRPLETAWREVTLSVSEGDGWDTGFDLSGPLDADRTVLYRLNGGTGRQAFVTNAVKPRQHDLAGALAFKLSTDTRLDLDFEWTDRSQAIYPGLPVPDPRNADSADAVPIDNFYGEAAGRFDGWHKLLTAKLQHRFNAQWSANLGFSDNKTRRDVKQIRLTGTTGNVVNRAANPFAQQWNVQTLQAELKGDLQLAGMRHRITLTLDRSGYDREGSSNNVGTVAATTLRNPQPTGATFSYGPVTTGEVRDIGVALQDYIELLPHWNLLAGVRRSSSREVNPGTPDQTGRSTDPTLGVIFKPQPTISIYASLARSFSPNAGTLLAANVYAPPSRGKQAELGAKADWLGGRLRTSASIYELTKSNVPTPSPLNPLFSEVSGEQRSRGAEFELQGQLTHDWNVSAGYGYTDSVITRDNVAANVGKTAAWTPRHTASLWSTYQLGHGWSLGGGVFHTGAKFVATNNLVAIPAHTLVDVMAAYRFRTGLPGARVQLNLRNLFDTRHYEGGGSSAAGFTNLYPGMPRTLSASLSVPF
ncbi:TonB-dependent receptor [Paucibacter sp. M5-1]|uniref:TonB-dependent receptor n=1 Tax=Paucibacter sp. M5-1 TaxID=3015998 RepID=UPI0022B8B8CF|nr:TonB-dependent siderophore receptor [Paucibacter sp. M5-1]MCZ7883980.1 TonB-dependent siderophore receptor [Paucibacter sp. M5-1]